MTYNSIYFLYKEKLIMTDRDYETHVRSNESIRDRMDGVLVEERSAESNKDSSDSQQGQKDDPNMFSRG